VKIHDQCSLISVCLCPTMQLFQVYSYGASYTGELVSIENAACV